MYVCAQCWQSSRDTQRPTFQVFFHAKKKYIYKMGQCSSRTSEQFNEFSSTTKLSEKRTPGISQEKWRADASQSEAAAERRRRGCGTHDDCSGLVFVADPTGGVWIDETLGRQR